MRHWILQGSLGALMFASPLRAQESEAAVIRAVHGYDAAWARRDTSMLGKLLAPSYRHDAGPTSADRNQTLALLALPASTQMSAIRDSIVVTLHGAQAMVASVLHTHAAARGRDFDETQRCTLELVEQPLWLITAERCEKIAPPPGATSKRGRGKR